jgi:hypothetical protein
MHALRIAFPLLLALLSSNLLAQDQAPKEDKYYPLKKGSTWEYVTAGKSFRIELVDFEMVGDTVASEHVAVKDDGVYRYKYNNIEISPPLKFLALPAAPDKTWQVDSKADTPTGEKLNLKGTFTTKAEAVKVPAGDYQTISSSSSSFEVMGQKLEMNYFFAPDVGMVKQIVKLGNSTVVVELQKYTPGGQQ